MTLVLLPGMDGTGMLFDAFVAALGDSCRVKVVRYPTKEAFGYSELEKVARAALPEDGPLVLLGESFSGPIAIALAESCSSRVKGLVLCCSFVRNPRPFANYLKPLIGWLPITANSTSRLRGILLGKFGSKALDTILAEAIAKVSAPAIRARLKAVVNVDVSETFAALNTPVLYLRASDDRVVPCAASELALRLKPHMRLVQLEAPHFLLQAAPVEAARIVSKFVHEVEDEKTTALSIHRETNGSFIT